MIYFAILLVIILIILQSRLGRWALKSVDCAIRSDQYLVEPDDGFTLRFCLTNRSRLPVFFLRVSCIFPLEAQPDPGQRGRLTSFIHQGRYTFSCYLMPGERYELPVVCRIGSRGLYRFNGLELAAGDMLGLYERSEHRSGTVDVVVKPALTEPGPEEDVLGGMMGEISVRRFIQEDPILTAGYREYTGREPYRSIAWNRSAQTGALMVKQFDHTSEPRVSVLLLPGNAAGEAFEAMMCLARRICSGLEQKGIAYSFCSNGDLYTQFGSLGFVEEGLGSAHENRILEGLGRGLPGRTAADRDFIRRIAASGELPESYLILGDRKDPELEACASYLEGTTGIPVILFCGEAEA